MSKKIHKVEEPPATYGAQKPAKAAIARPVNNDRQIRYIDPEKARKLTEEILEKRHELFRRLAQ